MLDLSGQWDLSDDTGQYTAPMSLPGDGITALHDAGVIPDPYWRQNEYDLRWIGERDWVLTRTFDLHRTDLELVITELDTVATVLLNGAEILRADIVMATRTIRAQSVIMPGDLTIADGEVPGAAEEAAQVVGQEARVAIYAGRPVRLSDIGPPAVIERNQLVPLVFQKNEIGRAHV